LFFYFSICGLAWFLCYDCLRCSLFLSLFLLSSLSIVVHSIDCCTASESEATKNAGRYFRLPNHKQAHPPLPLLLSSPEFAPRIFATCVNIKLAFMYSEVSMKPTIPRSWI
jgi:hypothetical protein